MSQGWEMKDILTQMVILGAILYSGKIKVSNKKLTKVTIVIRRSEVINHCNGSILKYWQNNFLVKLIYPLFANLLKED